MASSSQSSSTPKTPLEVSRELDEIHKEYLKYEKLLAITRSVYNAEKKQKRAFDRAAKAFIRRNELEMAALAKIDKVLKSKSPMDVAAEDATTITYKIPTGDKPQCFALVKVNKVTKQGLSITLYGMPRGSDSDRNPHFEKMLADFMKLNPKTKK